jgi:prepilin-type N-terminal cleavage/methylation domain-containing protein
MCPSAPSIDHPFALSVEASSASLRVEGRSRGFTLLEVSIGASLLAIVSVLALAQIDEGTCVLEHASAQADLRRQGEELAARIAQQLRSTQARYVAVPAGGTQLQLYKVTGYDPTTTPATPLLDQFEGSNIVYQYWFAPGPPPTASRYVNGQLFFQVDTAAVRNPAKSLAVAAELDPVAGFSVSAWSPQRAQLDLSALGLALPAKPFADAPVLLQVKLVLTRRLGRHFQKTGAADNWLATVTVESSVMLRPSEGY